jgi:hypothetical protein
MLTSFSVRDTVLNQRDNLTASFRARGVIPEGVRDVLASGDAIDGMAFLSTGEPREQ